MSLESVYIAILFRAAAGCALDKNGMLPNLYCKYSG